MGPLGHVRVCQKVLSGKIGPTLFARAEGGGQRVWNGVDGIDGDVVKEGGIRVAQIEADASCGCAVEGNMEELFPFDEGGDGTVGSEQFGTCPGVGQTAGGLRENSVLSILTMDEPALGGGAVEFKTDKCVLRDMRDDDTLLFR